MEIQNEIEELIDDANSSVGELEEALERQRARIVALEEKMELLCGRRWEGMTRPQIKNLGEKSLSKGLRD